MVLIRDATTGMLHRDITTGKLMRLVPIEYGNDCEYCDPGSTPKYISLLVTGLSDCLDCFDNQWKVTAGVAATLNGNITVLEQTTPCIWEKEYTGGNYGSVTWYAGYGCTGAPTNFTINECTFRVTKCAADGLLVNISVVATAAVAYGLTGMQVFAYEIHEPAPAWQCKTAVITNCIAVNLLANTVDCDEGGAWQYDMIACEGGLVSITEGA